MELNTIFVAGRILLVSSYYGTVEAARKKSDIKIIVSDPQNTNCSCCYCACVESGTDITIHHHRKMLIIWKSGCYILLVALGRFEQYSSTVFEGTVRRSSIHLRSRRKRNTRRFLYWKCQRFYQYVDDGPQSKRNWSKQNLSHQSQFNYRAYWQTWKRTFFFNTVNRMQWAEEVGGLSNLLRSS